MNKILLNYSILTYSMKHDNILQSILTRNNVVSKQNFKDSRVERGGFVLTLIILNAVLVILLSWMIYNNNE